MRYILLLLLTGVLFAGSGDKRPMTTAEKDAMLLQKSASQEVLSYHGKIISIDQEKKSVILNIKEQNKFVTLQMGESTFIQFFSRRKVLKRAKFEHLTRGMVLRFTSSAFHNALKAGVVLSGKAYPVSYIFIVQ